MSEIPIRQLLEKSNIHPYMKHLHQYFIVESDVVDQLLDAATLKSRDVVVEIGAGTGTITEALARRVQRVEAFEVDRRMCNILKQVRQKHPNIQLHFMDIKHGHWHKCDCVVANIPFNVIEPLLPRLVREHIRNITIIAGARLQKTLFGEGMFTKLGTMLRAFFTCEQAGEIHRGCFYPIPNEDAIILRLTPAQPRETFLQLCREIFLSPHMMVEHVIAEIEIADKQRRCLQGLDVFRKRADRVSNADLQAIRSCLIRK